MPGTSAFFGQPTISDEDFYVARWFLRGASLYSPAVLQLDPHNGIPFAPQPRPGMLKPHENISYSLFISTTSLLVIIIIIFLLRFGTKLLVPQLKSGWDDWVMILATVTSIISLGIAMKMAQDGLMGRHMWDLTYVEMAHEDSLAQILDLILPASISLLKVSMAIWLRRVIGNASRFWRFALDGLIVLLVCHAIVVGITLPLMVVPSRYTFDVIWAGAQETDYKIPKNLFAPIAAFTISGAVFDFLLLLIPAFIFIPMKMKFWRKVRMSLLFSLGSITTITASYRCVLTFKMNVTSGEYPDFTWLVGPMTKWFCAELGLSFLTANMPTMNVVGCKLVELIRKRRASQTDRDLESDRVKGQSTDESSSDQGEMKMNSRSDESSAEKSDSLKLKQTSTN